MSPAPSAVRTLGALNERLLADRRSFGELVDARRLGRRAERGAWPNAAAVCRLHAAAISLLVAAAARRRFGESREHVGRLRDEVGHVTARARAFLVVSCYGRVARLDKNAHRRAAHPVAWRR